MFLYNVSNGKAWLVNKLDFPDAVWIVSIHYVDCSCTQKDT